MAAYKGTYPPGGMAQSSQRAASPQWRRTPRYHPRYWFGYVWMLEESRYTGNELTWRTERQRAREVLAEAFEEGRPTRQGRTRPR